MPQELRPPIAKRLRETLRLLPHVGRTFRLLWATSPHLSVAITALTVANGVIPAGIAWVGKLIIDSVVAAARAGGLTGARTAAAGGAGAGADGGAPRSPTRLSALLRELLRAQLGNLVNVDILEKALTLELRHFEDADVYDKMQTRAARGLLAAAVDGARRCSASRRARSRSEATAFLLARLSGASVVILAVASIPAFLTEARMSNAVVPAQQLASAGDPRASTTSSGSSPATATSRR